MTESNGKGGHDVRQSTSSEEASSATRAPSLSNSASMAPILLTDEQSAQFLGISRRKFHELREQPFMPRAVVLGPRLVRWSRVELEQALSTMPRLEQPSTEPSQLARARIDRLKGKAVVKGRA
jgi:predicted DNA-binding transcriptional regulator AlpA